MLREIVALIGTSLFLFASPASAYVWKCHTPNGDVWTSQPAPSGDCEEYDDVYNPNAAPPPTTTQSPPSTNCSTGSSTSAAICRDSSPGTLLLFSWLLWTGSLSRTPSVWLPLRRLLWEALRGVLRRAVSALAQAPHASQRAGQLERECVNTYLGGRL